MNTDRLKELADNLRDALADAEAASETLRRSMTTAHAALGEIDGLLGGGKRNREPGVRKQAAMQAIHDAGGKFGGKGWADRPSLKTAAEKLATNTAPASVLVQEALSLSDKYTEKDGDRRRLTEIGDRWRSPR